MRNERSAWGEDTAPRREKVWRRSAADRRLLKYFTSALKHLIIAAGRYMTAIAINSASARLSGLPAQGGPQDGPARAARLAAALVGARGVAVLERDRAEQPGEWRLLAAEGAPIEPARLRAAAEAACASVREEAVHDGALAYQIGRSADEARTALILDLGVDLGADLGASPCDAEATARARLAAESARDALGRVRAERALCATRRALSRSVEDLSTAARLANIGIWSYDVSTGQMTWSPSFIGCTGSSPTRRSRPSRCSPSTRPKTRSGCGRRCEARRSRRSPSIWRQKALIDGAEKWVRVLGQPVIEDDAIVSLRGCVQDVTEEVQTREDMTLLATRDYLTEVANRASFTNLFEAMVKSCDFTQHSLYLFIIDVDHFKNINDSFGHDVGDQVLREVTQILFAAVRGSDVVGRLGGDEFGVFVSGARGAQLGDVVGDRIIEMTEQCETLRKINGGVTLSIGYAEAEGSTASFKSTLKAADLALYDAKRAGRNRAVRYRRELGDEYEKRERVLSEVAEALQREEILPYYQLKVGLQDGRVDGFEALARWDHPTRGVLTPWSFWGRPVRPAPGHPDLGDRSGAGGAGRRPAAAARAAIRPHRRERDGEADRRAQLSGAVQGGRGVQRRLLRRFRHRGDGGGAAGAQCRRHPIHDGGALPAGGHAVAGRLRHRLRVADPSAGLPDPHDQDRSELHQGHRDQSRKPGDRQRGDPHGAHRPRYLQGSLIFITAINKVTDKYYLPVTILVVIALSSLYIPHILK